jgi:hypothetical protein
VGTGTLLDLSNMMVCKLDLREIQCTKYTQTYQGLWNRLVYRADKEAYMGNQIVRMGILNCFEALITGT